MYNYNNLNDYNNYYFDQNANYNSENYPRTIEIDRLIFDFQENRRRINNLLKRISRLENYLRIKDDEEVL